VIEVRRVLMIGSTAVLVALFTPAFGSGGIVPEFNFKGIACNEYPAGQNYRAPTVVCDYVNGKKYVTSGYAIGINREWTWVVDIKTNTIIWKKKQHAGTTPPLYP
jgi:hypothetical protein